MKYVGQDAAKITTLVNWKLKVYIAGSSSEALLWLKRNVFELLGKHKTYVRKLWSFNFPKTHLKLKNGEMNLTKILVAQFVRIGKRYIAPTVAPTPLFELQAEGAKTVRPSTRPLVSTTGHDRHAKSRKAAPELLGLKLV